MENQRLILFVSLAFVLVMLWGAWQEDYGPKPTPTTVTESTEQSLGEIPSGLSQAPRTPDDSFVAPEAAVEPSAGGEAPAQRAQTINKGSRIFVVTDTLAVEIDSLGGDIRRVDLLNYPVSSKQPDDPVRLMSDSPSKLFVAQTGLVAKSLRATDGEEIPFAPTHHALYDFEKDEYRIAAGQDSIVVPLTWTNGQGVTVVKTFTFPRDGYDIKIDHNVINESNQEWRGYQYRQFQRVKTERESFLLYTFTGAVISTPEDNYIKYEFDELKESNLNLDHKNGWAAMIQHYFIGAWVPDAEETNHYYSKALKDERYVLGLSSPTKTVASGGQDTFVSTLYVGPKIQDDLDELADNLELTVDYGFLWFIARPLFIVLQWIYETLTGNWGWAIIFLTILIKLAFYKLSATSYRSMANMRRLQPKIEQLRERYGEDRQRMGQAMMELYKKEKINPLGGCLPMMIQIPVFIALYWVLLESTELRQATFMLWITDLSVRDPYYILPILMGVSMFIQQKLNPPPPDPMQAKIFMALPFVFTFFFAFFPAGLVLYWVVNNVLSIAQHWYIMRKVEKEHEAAKAAAKKPA